MATKTAQTTVPESHRDLLQAPVAVLTTVGADGFPQTTALWFLADDDGQIRLSLNSSRQKVKNLQRRPECGLLIIDPANPYRTLEVRARAELAPDPDYGFADRLGRKYGGVDLRAMDRPGDKRLIVTLRPLKVNTYGPAA
jgi:PPOX class probable F420-dependent enzyme